MGSVVLALAASVWLVLAVLVAKVEHMGGEPVLKVVVKMVYKVWLPIDLSTSNCGQSKHGGVRPLGQFLKLGVGWGIVL